jgi:putative two-component system response regulator
MTAMKRHTIMLVDDNLANLNIGKSMLKDRYEVYALPSAERLFTFLEAVTPDLILLDIKMPDMNGFDVIRILKTDTRYSAVPVIFVTAMAEEVNELEGFALGAADYVSKPFSAAILLKRIENQLLIEQQKFELKNLNGKLLAMLRAKFTQVSSLQNLIINSLAELVEFRDAFTGGHISRTQKYVELLINGMIERDVYSGELLSWENMEHIVPSTQLHDLGKIFISDVILNKPGKLTDDEFEIMKTHAAKGAEAIRRLAGKGENSIFLKYAEIAAGTHHEKWDGSGYPAGLKGREIPLLGRLLAIADVYDALTSHRPYKLACDTEESAGIIIAASGTHFDPALVKVFKTLREDFAAIARTDCASDG